MIITIKGSTVDIFKDSNIGTLSTYNISTVLGEAEYDGPTSVDKNTALNATVTIAEGYEVGTAGVTVTMGGTAVTSGISQSGNVITINIGSVTGNVVIKVPTKNVATGEEEEPDTPVNPNPPSGDTTTVDITPQFIFTEGKMISANNGTESTYSGWVASDYVDISAYSSIEIKMSKTSSTNTGTGLAFYDADKNYVSGVPHTDGVATYGTMIKTIEIPSNVKYVRTTYWSTSNSNYETEFGDFYCKGIIVNTDSEPVTPDEPVVGDGEWVDITDQFVFVDDALLSASDGRYTNYAGWAANENYVDISAYSELEFKMSKTSSTGTGSGVAFYDANKTFVSGIPHTDGDATYGIMIKNVEVTSNMHYMRALYWKKSSENYKPEFGDFYCKAKLK